jgi:hypothetical protein
MLDLNTISFQDLQNEILLSEDLSQFYITLDEQRFLNSGYSLAELLYLLESWLEINADNI